MISLWYRHPAGTEQVSSFFLKSCTHQERVPKCKWCLGNDPCPVRRVLFGPDQKKAMRVAETTEFQCRRPFPGKAEITNAGVSSGSPSLQTPIHEFQIKTVFLFLSGCFCGLFHPFMVVFCLFFSHFYS